LPLAQGAVIPREQFQPARRQTTICQVLHSLRMGGAEVLAARLARQLGDTYRFVFACLDEIGTLGHELQGEGFPVELLGRRPGIDWKGSVRLAKFLRREQVDLLHAHQYTPFFYSTMARFFYRRPSILFTEHGRHFPDYPRRKRMIANRLLLKGRDRVIGVGEAVRQALVRNEGMRAERVGVVYNGVDLTPFQHGSSQREIVRREIGVEATGPVILQVARLDYLKDHATAIRMLERVVRVRRQARLVLVGDGPEQTKIEELIRQRNLGAHVRLLGLRNDVARLLSAADVFLLTSISEGIPLTLIEAMAAGLPVVATRVGGIGEVVVDGETSLLAASGDDAALAESILRLADNPDLGRQLGTNGRERAFAMFSEAKMHAGYRQLYREMLGD
jgi:glycosyltransferase involved in cell wall biosynthesis